MHQVGFSSHEYIEMHDQQNKNKKNQVLWFMTTFVFEYIPKSWSRCYHENRRSKFLLQNGRLVNPLQLELPDDRQADGLQITRFHKNRIFFSAHVYAATRDVLGSALTSPPVTTNAIAMNNKADQKFNYGTKYH